MRPFYLVLLAASPLTAQTVPALTLKPANARLPEEFTVVGSVRELADGRVLIADERENRLVVADAAFAGVTPIGRKGEGPEEYQQVSRLWSIGGDSTLMAERFARRWHLLVGSRIVASVPGSSAGPALIGSSPFSGADAHGHVVATVGRLVGGALPDSAPLVRFNRLTNRSDTVSSMAATLTGGGGRGIASSGPPANGKARYAIGINGKDMALLFEDGWIAIARVNPYRIDWCTPAGRCTRGPLLPGQPQAATDRDRQAYLDFSAKTSGWPKTTVLAETSEWPDKLPPFAPPKQRLDGSALLGLPDGRLLVERLPTPAQPTRRYDVIDRRGALVGTIALPMMQQIAGFGARSIYVTVIDEDGVQRLERHGWP